MIALLSTSQHARAQLGVVLKSCEGPRSVTHRLAATLCQCKDLTLGAAEQRVTGYTTPPQCTTAQHARAQLGVAISSCDDFVNRCLARFSAWFLDQTLETAEQRVTGSHQHCNAPPASSAGSTAHQGCTDLPLTIHTC
jgi:hypothetical protein